MSEKERRSKEAIHERKTGSVYFVGYLRGVGPSQGTDVMSQSRKKGLICALNRHFGG
jgi:hypothetical protein